MIEILTAAQMKVADSDTIASGTSGITLMKAAGQALADVANTLQPTGPVLVIVAKSNNGGDGFVAARYMRAAGRDVSLMMLGNPTTLTGDAALAHSDWTGDILPATPDFPPPRSSSTRSLAPASTAPSPALPPRSSRP